MTFFISPSPVWSDACSKPRFNYSSNCLRAIRSGVRLSWKPAAGIAPGRPGRDYIMPVNNVQTHLLALLARTGDARNQ